MNAEPESDFIKELQKEFRILSNPKQHTFPAPAPKETIDYVAVFKQNDKGFAVVSSEVVNEPVASDHRLLLWNCALPKRRIRYSVLTPICRIRLEME